MDRIERIFSTNVLGMVSAMKAVIPAMRKRGSGAIINVSSIGGNLAFPTGSLYHGTKFAVEGLSEALFFELDAIGVRMRIIEPGFVETNFGGAGFDRGFDETLTEYSDVSAGTGRMFASLATSRAQPDAVADVIWQAANDPSDQLRYLVGEDEAVRLCRERGQMTDAEFIADLKQRMQGSDA